MKLIKQLSLYFLLATIIYPSSIKAQNEARINNNHYKNSLGERGVTHLFYSLENKNYKTKWELLDGSRYSVNYHFLDQDGNLIRKYREFTDSITSNSFYKYDQKN